MTVIEEEGSLYGMVLADGYLTPKLAGRRWRRCGENFPLESRVAYYLYRRARRTDEAYQCLRHNKETSIVAPLLVHVWVLGNGKWVTQPPGPLAELVGQERDLFYRVVLVGQGTLGLPTAASRWPYWLKMSGLVDKRRPAREEEQFRESARQYLTHIAALCRDNDYDGKSVRRAIGLPSVFFGDPR